MGCNLLDCCGGGCAARSYLHHAILNNIKSFIQQDIYCFKNNEVNTRFSEVKLVDTKEDLVHIDYLCTWIGKPK
jgi:hypothetical protein